MSKEYYAVARLKEDLTVEVMGINRTVPLKFADGMVGAMPIFESKEAAQAWAIPDTEIYKLWVSDETT